MSSQSSQHSAGRLSNRNAQEEIANGTHLQPFTVRPSIPATFTTKLYAMIQDERQSLITWSPSGDRFRVHNVSEFSSSILPQYFKHSNWPSFVRQLNMYGFRKVSSGLQDVDDASSSDLSRQIWEFKHDDFRKGGQNRLHLIRRKSTRAPRSPFQYRFTNSMETLQDTADVEGQAKSLQSMENQKHNQLRESEQAVHNLQLQAQQLCHEMQKLKSLAARQQAILSQTIDVLADILQNTTKGHPLNREEASLDHLKRTLCELLPDDRQLPNVPVTGAIIEERGFQLKIPARESDQEFCLPYDPVFDKTDYRRNTSDESGSNEWTRSIKRKENGSSMNPYAGSLGTDPDIGSNVQHAMQGSPG